MHYCTKCGTEVSDKVKFCPKCGAIQKINIKELNNNSNDYTKVMPIIHPTMSQEDTEIYEDDSPKRDIIKLVVIGILIGIFILAAGFSGYYFYTKNDNISSYQNSNKTTAAATDSKNSESDENSNTPESNAETTYGDYIFNDSSNAKLTDTQLNSLSKEKLAFARNEIYARHGYVFQTEPYKSYFANKTWYTADPSFKGSDEELNEVEKYNVQLILEYEKKI